MFGLELRVFFFARAVFSRGSFGEGNEQLNTMHWMPMAFARSLLDSVLPVPAGPAGAAPSFRLYAPVMVIQQRSVRGVITRRVVAPWYS